MSTLTIRQGEDCVIEISSIVGADGQPLDVTGWEIRAMARPKALSAELWQEWVSGTPTDSQGAAQVVAGVVELEVTHVMSSAWTWTNQTGVLHVEATEPGGQQRRARVGEQRIYLDPEAVR